MAIDDVRRLELFSPDLQRALTLTVERGQLACRLFVRSREVARAVAGLAAGNSDVWMYETGGGEDSEGVQLGVSGATFPLTCAESKKVSAFLGVGVVSYEELMRLCLEQI